MIEKGSLAYYILIIFLSGLAAWITVTINKYVFKKIQNKRAHIHLMFFEKISSLLLVVICIIVGLSFFSGVESLWKSILGGTAVISAVAIFAAQDVIKDVLAGLMISIYKPFEIGNRIELEDGQSGIVKHINMRHVIIHTWGSRELIIPNSKLNTMLLFNNSYHTGTKSYQAEFRIGYTSNVKKAMDVIKNAVIESPYTSEGRYDNEGQRIYDNVYFMAYEASSLLMQTTVYYKVAPIEVVRSDVNTRVNDALIANGIEIPYAYINVINKA